MTAPVTQDKRAFEMPVSHERALQAAQRLINSHFGNGQDVAQTRIPANADDDDLIITRYIRQQAALTTPPADMEGAVEAAAKELAKWIGYSWDGLRDDGRITDRGFEPWTPTGKFQGSKQDLRDIVLRITSMTALQRAEWQLIETAPKDGSEILILTNIGVTQARFAPGEWHNHQEGREYEGPVWVCCDDQWEIEIEDAGEHGMYHGIATHWMPLPAAPVVAEQRIGEYAADYTPLTETEMKAPTPEVDELMANSKPISSQQRSET